MNAMASKRSRSLGAVLIAASAWLSGSVWAANSSGLEIQFKGVQPSDSVSVSRLPGLPVNVAYRILVRNPVTNPNTINQVVFTGSTYVAGYAGFVSLDGSSPNCPVVVPPVNMSVTSVSCQIGQLRSGDSREFFLLFQTPNVGTLETKIKFDGHTQFSMGGSSSSTASTYDKDLDPVYIDLTTSVPDGPNGYNKKVKTVLSTDGGTFFTGIGGTVNPNNQWSAKVAIPATSVVTNNEIHLLPDDLPPTSFTCAPGYYCYGLSSHISILDASQVDVKLVLDPDQTNSYLTITLRQDASSLALKNPFPAIGDIKIFYNAAPTLDIADVGTVVLDCSPALPTAGHPCIFGRDASNLSKNKKSGYYEWTIHAKDNGKYTQ